MIQRYINPCFDLLGCSKEERAQRQKLETIITRMAPIVETAVRVGAQSGEAGKFMDTHLQPSTEVIQRTIVATILLLSRLSLRKQNALSQKQEPAPSSPLST